MNQNKTQTMKSARRYITPLVILNFLFFISNIAQCKACCTSDDPSAVTQPTDTIQSDHSATSTPLYSNNNFSYKKLIAPSLLIASGAMAIPIHDKLGEWGNPKPIHFDDYSQYAPVAAYLFAGLAIDDNRRNFGERVQIAATAYIIEASIVNIIKYTVREQRPDHGRHNSFPSGHTATVVTGAELCRLEYGWKIGLCAYSVATVTAGLRIYNHRHWCNDVLAGAGIGILSANAAYWLFPLEKRLFTKRNKNRESSNQAFALPFYEPESKTAHLAVHLTF